ncbi:hypothetical protein MLD38_011996 [Melastoma candidum]|uniref:Uncharacterized protein n=1 Tax=Melastoma candidum TaxID=119954 RepID=A0ACB9R8H2_9MYRT|nr:hypothetical protein MLD38_011996 [Melastoma candidum]
MEQSLLFLRIRRLELSGVDDFLKWASDPRVTRYLRPGTGDGRCRAHMSYAIVAEHWGKGVATTALRMVVPRVFGEFPEVCRVEAFVEVGNWASERVLEKVGW